MESKIQLKNRRGEKTYPLTLAQCVIIDGGGYLSDYLENMKGNEGDTDGRPPQLFIDMWNEGCGDAGNYNPEGAPDSDHPFYLNELWLTYEEALTVHRESCGGLFALKPNFKNRCKARTFYPFTSTNGGYTANTPGEYQFSNCENLEVVRLGYYTPIYSNMFRACNKLRKIICTLLVIQGIGPISPFASAPLMESFKLQRLDKDVSFANNPLIDLTSFNDMIKYAQNSSAITITVHSGIWAKLQDEENEEWHALLALAESKNITFATA